MSRLKQTTSGRRSRSALALTSLTAALTLTMACGSKPTTTPVSADAWAVVNGRNISRQDVERAYRRTQDPAQALSDEEALTVKLNVLNDLVTQEILLEKAAQLKLDVAAGEIDTAYGEAKKNIPDEAFQQELTRRNVTAAASNIRSNTRAGVCGARAKRLSNAT